VFHYEAEQARHKIQQGSINLRLKGEVWAPDTMIDRAALRLLDIRLPQKLAYPGIEDEILPLFSDKAFVCFMEKANA